MVSLASLGHINKGSGRTSSGSACLTGPSWHPVPPYRKEGTTGALGDRQGLGSLQLWLQQHFSVAPAARAVRGDGRGVEAARPGHRKLICPVSASFANSIDPNSLGLAAVDSKG